MVREGDGVDYTLLVKPKKKIITLPNEQKRHLQETHLHQLKGDASCVWIIQTLF